jgi:hypothetical protein
MEITNSTVYQLAQQTTKILVAKQDTLKKIEWVRGEANLDYEFSLVACESCEEAWSQINDSYPDVTLECNRPDIQLTFTIPDGATIEKKIELKSSTSRSLPGSTIKMIDINQPLIYCLRPSGGRTQYKNRCYVYHDSMETGHYDLFQDRTPRPRVSFDRMNSRKKYKEKAKGEWVERYAKCAINRLSAEQPPPTSSWQDGLVEAIIDEYLRNTDIAAVIERKQRAHGSNYHRNLRT